MKPPPQPFSGEGEDRPIPLEEGASSVPERPYAGIIEEAERLVLDARAAMTREETDPYLALSEHAAVAAVPRRRAYLNRSLTRRAAALFLAGSCALAFAHGWGMGSAARAQSHDDSRCGAGHCQP